MNNTEVLKNKKIQLKGAATRLENFLSSVNSDTSVVEIRVWLEKVQSLYESINLWESESAVVAESIPDRDSELEELFSRYFRLKVKCTELLEVRQKVLEIPESLNSTSMNQYFVQKLLESQTTFLKKWQSYSLLTR